MAGWLDAGLPAAPQDVWKKVLDEDFQLLGTWDTTAAGALEAARQGDWPLCAYLAARCFKEAEASRKGGGAEALATPDEQARRKVWLRAARPVILDVPPGREKLRVHFQDKPGAELIRTDRIKECFLSGDEFKVLLHDRRSGTLPSEPEGIADFLVPGTTVDMSYRAWLSGSGSKTPPRAATVCQNSKGQQNAWNVSRRAPSPAYDAGDTTMRLVSAQSEEDLLQLRAFMSAKTLRVTMRSASVLGTDGFPDSYCSCRLASQSMVSRATTAIVESASSPVWNEMVFLESFEANDALVFELWDHRRDRDVLLGSIELPVYQIQGELSQDLELETKGGVAAKLKVHIMPLDTRGAPEFLRHMATPGAQSAKLANPVPFGKYQVLAYPIGENFTKALLRPIKVDGAVLDDVGETLISQCAKAGQWEFAGTLLKAEVPMPDLSTEFARLCGSHAGVQRQWANDLAAVGAGRSQSLVLLATRANGSLALRSSRDSSQLALRTMIQHHLKVGRAKCLSAGPELLIKRLAREEQWDLVQVLLEELQQSGSPDILPGEHLPEFLLKAGAPAELRTLANEYQSDQTLQGPRATSIREYFERQLWGEVLCEANLPEGFAQEGGSLVREDSDEMVAVLGQAVRLCEHTPGSDTAGVVLVQITKAELEDACDAVDDTGCAMLPLDVRGKAIAGGSEPLRSGWWVAVCCPKSYYKDSSKFRIPPGRFASPYIPRVTVCVATTSPCCESAIAGVLVHVNGHRVGVTDHNGELSLALPRGEHAIAAVEQDEHGVDVIDQQVICVSQGGGERPLHVRLETSGKVYAYLLRACDDDSASASVRHQVMVVASKSQIPDEAEPFKSLGSSRPRKAHASDDMMILQQRDRIPHARALSAGRARTQSMRIGGGYHYKKSVGEGRSRAPGIDPIITVQPHCNCNAMLHKLQNQLCRYATPIVRACIYGFSQSPLSSPFTESVDAKECFKAWAAYARVGPPLSEADQRDLGMSQDAEFPDWPDFSQEGITYHPKFEFARRTDMSDQDNECALCRLSNPACVGDMISCSQLVLARSDTTRASSSTAGSSQPRRRPPLDISGGTNVLRSQYGLPYRQGPYAQANVHAVCSRLAAERVLASRPRPSSASPSTQGGGQPLSRTRASSVGRPPMRTHSATRTRSSGLGQPQRQPQRELRPTSLRW